MAASVSVTTASVQPPPPQRHAQYKKKISQETKPKAAPLQGKLKSRKVRSKKTSKLVIDAADSAAIVDDYHDALWYKAGEGDLLFAHWLLGRCNGVGDAMTPQSADVLKRMFALYHLQCKLRQELSQSSKQEVNGKAEATEHKGDVEEAFWSVEEIVEQVGDVLRVSRLELMKQQEAAEKSNTKRRGSFERTVVTEVVESATELILSRATSEDEVLLRRWIDLLRKEEKMETDVMIGSVREGCTEMNAGDTKVTKQKRKKHEEKMRVRKKPTKTAEETACEQVESFLTFLAESAQTPALATASVTAAPSEVEKTWTLELQQIVESSSIGPQEEERRLQVARDIQAVLRREVSQWRHCEVILYGSSLTHYGSKRSDLDMCLLSNGHSTDKCVNPSEAVVGKREVQRLIDGKSGENGHVLSDAGAARQLSDTGALVRKSIEKLTQALNALDRSGVNGDKLAKQQYHLEFFYDQMRLLRNAILAELSKLPESHVTNESMGAHLQATIAASKRRTGDLYRIREILQRVVKCEVRQVIVGARVPIIRFMHTRSGCDYECDLCFGNVLATHNTPLLRAYASFDDSARVLGLAVKHWVKQRGISDASMGFLSSYSFVLLTIFYLQVVHVLPNLQDPKLLEYAHVEPVYVNDVNIAFCKERDIAQAYHQLTSAGGISGLSVARLLVGFFEFYATQFNFAKRVVTVRAPETPVLKLQQWGSRKAKTWRLSIQDPLETGRDLGCVLQFKGQEKIICELRRAHRMLVQGGSFIDEVCAVEKSVDKMGKVGKAKQKSGVAALANRVQGDRPLQQADEDKRSFLLSLESADEGLTKELIELLFKDFQASISVAKVVEATTFDATAGDDNDAGYTRKRWEVELRTHGKKYPRRLSGTTRIDWESVDGRGGRVWLHHQAIYATPPCRQCLSPKHATSTCLINGGHEGDDYGGAGDRGEQVDKKTADRNTHRRVLRLKLQSGAEVTLVKQGGRRKKQQQQDGVSEQAQSITTTKPSNRRRANELGKKKFRGKKLPETEQIATEPIGLMKVVTVAASAQGKGEGGTAGKTLQKKKKWQQRVYRKRDV
uniref:Uncharacterized protein n=1 Tax=Hyaloperonospora arabidopsidis (strain Emoy2) TaxID=559515 RepID=M4BQI4_HYAAE